MFFGVFFKFLSKQFLGFDDQFVLFLQRVYPGQQPSCPILQSVPAALLFHRLSRFMSATSLSFTAADSLKPLGGPGGVILVAVVLVFYNFA